MDLLCLRCGEPWDFDSVLHDFPEEFERNGCVISRCPICIDKDQVVLSSERRDELNALVALGELYGGDLDGFAVFLADRGLT